MIPRRSPLQRSGPPQRKTPLPRASAPIPRSSLKRKRKPAASAAKDFAREYGSRARVKFVSRLPCAACDYAGPIRRDNAHTKTGGTSRKGPYTSIIPLCVAGTPMNCHGRQHGVNGGWLKIGMTAESRARAAANTEAAWLEHRAGTDDDESDGTVDTFEDAA